MTNKDIKNIKNIKNINKMGYYDFLNDALQMYKQLNVPYTEADVEMNEDTYERLNDLLIGFPALDINRPVDDLTDDEFARMVDVLEVLFDILGTRYDQIKQAKRIVRINITDVTDEGGDNENGAGSETK